MLKFFTLMLGLLGLAATAGFFFDGQSLASGSRTSLHGNGEPKETTTFVEGLRHGHTTRWYADGTLRAEGQFEQGKMTGEWVWQLPDGSVDAKRSGNYAGGTLLSNR